MTQNKLLFKWLLKYRYTISTDKKERRNKLLTYAIVAVVFLPVLISMLVGLYTLTPHFYTQGLLPELINLLLGMVTVTIGFFSLMSLIGNMYLSKDNAMLLGLPIKPDVIFWVKLAIEYLSELIFTVIVLVPIYIVLAVAMAGAGLSIPISYFFFASLSVLLVPLYSLMLISVLSVPLIKLINYLKNKNGLKTIVSVLLFVVLFSGYALIIEKTSSTAPQNENASDMDSIISAIGPALKVQSSLFFLTAPLANVIMAKGLLLNLLYTVLISAALAVGGYWLVSKTYVSCLRIQLEGNGKGKKIKRENDDGFVASSQMRALIGRELKLILRDTNLVMNGLIGIVATPVVLLIMFFSTKDQFGGDGMMVLIAAFIGLFFLSSANTVPAVIFSKDGEYFSINKYLPVSAEDLVRGRVLTVTLFNSIGAILYTIVLMIIIRSSVFIGISLGLNVFLVSTGLSQIGIDADLRKPKLKWDNITQVVKQGSNVLLHMLRSVAVAVVCIVPLALTTFVGSIKKPYLISFLIMTIVGVAVNIVGSNKLKKHADSYLYRIEQ